MTGNAATMTNRRYAALLAGAEEMKVMTQQDAKRRYAALVARFNRPRRLPKRGWRGR